jgi:hypothetical protein
MTQPSSAAIPSVAWLVERAKVSDEATPFVATAADGGALVQALTANGKTTEAVKVIAAALPPREGVWWAWVSARHAAQFGTPGGSPAPVVTEALAAVEQWIANPDDERRRAAWAAGERAGFESPAGCAAAAVFFTAGSVAPADVTPVPPPAGIDRMLVGNAVALAAAANPDLFEALAGAYIAQGLEVVKQLGGWEKSVAMSQEHFQSQHERHVRATMPPSDGANQRAGS